MQSLTDPELGPIEFHKNPRAKNYRITLKPNLVRVTVPRLGSFRKAEQFLCSKKEWVLKKQQERPPIINLSPTEVERLRAEAKGYIPERVKVLADQHGFDYSGVRIKNMTSRWGSCSSKKNLNFSLHLMRLDSVYIDYVILHELAHTVEMNHGPNFWELLESVCPGAKKIDREMRQFGLQVG